MAAMAMGTVVYVFQWSAGPFGFSGMINRLDSLGYRPQPSRLSLWSEVMMLAPFGDGVDPHVATTVLTASATNVWQYLSAAFFRYSSVAVACRAQNRLFVFFYGFVFLMKK